MALAVVDSVQCIGIQEDPEQNAPLDLHRVEIMNLPHSTYSMATEETKDMEPTSCIHVKGIVMDHGSRHPGMPTQLKN